MKSITITISVPHRCLSPNARTHWRAKAKARSQQRADACIIAMGDAKGERFRWPAASVKVKWFSKTANGLRMDHDNIIGSLKGAIDGLADAGIVANDRGVTWLPPVVEVDKANPRVELIVTEVK